MNFGNIHFEAAYARQPGEKMAGRNHDKTLNNQPFWKRHSLSLTATGILALWLVLYIRSDPKTHVGSFFGNAIADWIGVVMTILATKYFFERGSPESREPKKEHKNRILEFLHEHSLTIFLVITGIGWVAIFLKVDPDSKWGTVVSNVVSEWSQQLGLVLLTKKLIEAGSKESSDDTKSSDDPKTSGSR
jgi:peptidoglycan/LPS O-acetylase OafA/YrhL